MSGKLTIPMIEKAGTTSGRTQVGKFWKIVNFPRNKAEESTLRVP